MDSTSAGRAGKFGSDSEPVPVGMGVGTPAAVVPGGRSRSRGVPLPGDVVVPGLPV